MEYSSGNTTLKFFSVPELSDSMTGIPVHIEFEKNANNNNNNTTNKNS